MFRYTRRRLGWTIFVLALAGMLAFPVYQSVTQDGPTTDSAIKVSSQRLEPQQPEPLRDVSLHGAVVIVTRVPVMVPGLDAMSNNPVRIRERAGYDAVPVEADVIVGTRQTIVIPIHGWMLNPLIPHDDS